MSEGVLVSMIDGSCDEEMFDQVRKIFMMMVNWKRRNKTISWDVESFGNKCNEGLVDSCLAMHY